MVVWLGVHQGIKIIVEIIAGLIRPYIDYQAAICGWTKPAFTPGIGFVITCCNQQADRSGHIK